MKKLFFAAAVAIVAVGGALSAQATTYFYPSSTGEQSINCDLGETGCLVGVPTNVQFSTTSGGPYTIPQSELENQDRL